MDWVQKYNLGIHDLHEVHWIVKFFKRGYAGSVIELLGAEDPITFDFQNESDNPFAPIKASQVTISVEEITGLFTIADLYSVEDKNCYVEIYQGTNLYWTGYVDPKQYTEPYDVTPYIISITCIDGLTLLDDMPFMLNEDTELVWRKCNRALVYYNGRMLESRIIFAILERIVLDEEGDSGFQGTVTFNEYINIYEILMNNSINDSPLDQTMIDVDVFFGMSCGDVLRKLLSKHNACIRQRNGIFCIYRPKEVLKAVVYGRQFVGTFAIGTQTKTSISYVPTQYINRAGHDTNIKQVSGGNVMQQALAKKVNINQDYGNKESWLNNWELKVETWNGSNFEYWTQDTENTIRLISDELHLEDEEAGLVIPAHNTHRLYSVYQSFGINAIASEADSFVFSFDYLHSNYSGIEIPHIYVNVSVKAHGINTYLYGTKEDENSNEWVLAWADLPMILDDPNKCFITIKEDVPIGGSGWKTFKGKVVGLPAGGVYTVTLYNSYGWTNQDHTQTITTAFKNIRFYAASMQLAALKVKRNFWQRIQGGYGGEYQVRSKYYIKNSKEEVENIAEHTYTVNNDIAGEEFDYDYILGDVITTSPLLYKGDVNIENILEQFAGALATTGGAPQNRVDIVTLHLNSTFFTPSGTAIITCSGISKTATYNSSLTQTAVDFVTAFASFWAAIGITLTNSGASLLFTSDYVGVEFIGSTTIATQIGLLDGDVTYTPSHESGIHPTTKWNTRDGVEDKPLLEIVGDEIALQYSRPAQFIDMPLQETSGESTLNLLGNIQDDMNKVEDSSGAANIGFVVNRGSFGVRYRQWKLDLVDMVGEVEEGVIVDNEAPTGLVLTVVSDTRIDLVWVDNDGNEDGFSIERSTDGINYAEIITVAANAEAYSNTGLTECAQYYYRIRAYTGAVYTPYSNVANAYTLLLPPTTLEAVAVANTQISLTWVDASSNEDGFVIERGLSNIAFVVIASTAAGVISYLDIDLIENTQYFYRVRAFKGTRYSTYSNTDDATTSELLAPTLLTSLAVSDTEIDLSWEENAVNEDGYEVERSLDGITWTKDAFIGETSSGNASYQCINLTEGTRYYYRIRAYKWRVGESGIIDSNSSYNDEVDYSEYSNITFDTTWPAAPTLLVMTVVSDTQVDLVWVDNSNHEDGYEVERSLDGNTWAVVLYAGTLVEDFSDTDLEEYTHYYYRVRAFKLRESDDLDELDSDSSGSPESDYSLYSNVVDSYTLLATPTDLTATAITDVRIDLDWEDNSDKEEGYKIERSVDNVTFVEIDSIVVDSSGGDFYQNIQLTPHTFYYYRVRAFATNGYSAYSNMAHVYTKPALDTIDVTASALPTIANYDTAVITKYNATYLTVFGSYPNARLFYIDENGDVWRWMQQPKFTIVANVVISISWDVGFDMTGFIILQ